MTDIICDICECASATKFYRNYLGPHAICDDCFYSIVKPRAAKNKYTPLMIDKEEYVEDRVIDEIMGN